MRKKNFDLDESESEEIYYCITDNGDTVPSKGKSVVACLENDNEAKNPFKKSSIKVSFKDFNAGKVSILEKKSKCMFNNILTKYSCTEDGRDYNLVNYYCNSGCDYDHCRGSRYDIDAWKSKGKEYFACKGLDDKAGDIFVKSSIMVGYKDKNDGKEYYTKIPSDCEGNVLIKPYCTADEKDYLVKNYDCVYGCNKKEGACNKNPVTPKPESLKASELCSAYPIEADSSITDAITSTETQTSSESASVSAECPQALTGDENILNSVVEIKSYDEKGNYKDTNKGVVIGTRQNNGKIQAIIVSKRFSSLQLSDEHRIVLKDKEVSAKAERYGYNLFIFSIDIENKCDVSSVSLLKDGDLIGKGCKVLDFMSGKYIVREISDFDAKAYILNPPKTGIVGFNAKYKFDKLYNQPIFSNDGKKLLGFVGKQKTNPENFVTYEEINTELINAGIKL